MVKQSRGLKGVKFGIKVGLKNSDLELEAKRTQHFLWPRKSPVGLSFGQGKVDSALYVVL